MEEALKTTLKENGVNLTVGLERFLGNEALFEKFLRKFLLDSSFKEMSQSMEIGDTSEAFKAAHTLKGVAGNLSIDGVYHSVIPVMEALRLGNLTEVYHFPFFYITVVLYCLFTFLLCYVSV